MRRWLDPASVTDITVGVMPFTAMAGHDDFAVAAVAETHCRAGSSALERADIITGKA